jgi:hypothetical protein
MENSKKNLANSSSSIIIKEDDEPPDISGISTITKNNIRTKLTEPSRKLGSFLVPEGKLKNISVEIISDIKSCHDLWEEFSPKKVLFDTWEFRFAFYKGYEYEPYFILLKKDFENVALLPLWYDLKGYYVWFGSDWQEETTFFTRDKKYIPFLLSLAPSPLLLNAIPKKAIERLKGKIDFTKDDSKYVLSLEGYKTHEDYLMALTKNSRHALRKDRRRIERQNPKITFDNFSDLKKLIKLAQERFNARGEDVDWKDKRRIETFKQIIKLAGKSYVSRMITITIGGKPAGVDLVCLYNNTYYAVKCGYNVDKFPGIGNFMNIIEIDDAIKLGMEKVDFLQNNYNWKSQYFEEVELFQYAK